MLPDNILEVLLEKIINNWRKVYGSFIGYKLGDSSFTKKMKKTIINRLKED